ncbi:hypothetical protein ACRAWF_24325 [Streptomyces sp. L7]
MSRSRTASSDSVRFAVFSLRNSNGQVPHQKLSSKAGSPSTTSSLRPGPPPFSRRSASKRSRALGGRDTEPARLVKLDHHASDGTGIARIRTTRRRTRAPVQGHDAPLSPA